MTFTSAHAAALWSGLLLILMVVLSVRVVGQRRKHRVTVGDAGAPELMQAVRAFGNAAEYVPAGIGALAILAHVDPPAFVTHVTGLALFAGRVIHAIALSRTTGTSLGRAAGMMLTWVAYLFAAVALLFYSL
ncbi:MAG: glutathione S-transferase [Caulobacteraceae bacterium]|nr:glutathione S-transferase [Caulobacteraceae bacterium]